jgi:hypothetical protein
VTKIAKPTERDESQILADIDAQNVALVAAHEIDALQSRRRSLLTAGDVEGIHELGAAISRATVTVEIAEAKVNALELELEALYQAQRQARVVADTAKAQALAERERALISVYAEAAARSAEALAELGPIHRKLSLLNLNLPIRIEPVGTHLPHLAKLPGRGHSDEAFWPPRYRVQAEGEAVGR